MIMICTWNRTIPHNENDLKRATAFSLGETHPRINPFTCATLQYLHLHSALFSSHPVLGLLEAAICSPLFSPLIPLLSSPSLANKISSALIYSQASWTFLWAPWSSVSLLLPPLRHPPPAPTSSEMSDVTPLTHATPGSRMFLCHDHFIF